MLIVKRSIHSANGTPSGIRLISPQKHRDLKRKVFTIHETLLRRLAEHDPPLVTVEE